MSKHKSKPKRKKYPTLKRYLDKASLDDNRMPEGFAQKLFAALSECKVKRTVYFTDFDK